MMTALIVVGSLLAYATLGGAVAALFKARTSWFADGPASSVDAVICAVVWPMSFIVFAGWFSFRQAYRLLDRPLPRHEPRHEPEGPYR